MFGVVINSVDFSRRRTSYKYYGYGYNYAYESDEVEEAGTDTGEPPVQVG